MWLFCRLGTESFWNASPSRQTDGYQPCLFVSSTYWRYPTDLLKTPTGSCPQHSPWGRKIHITFPPSKQQAIIQDRAACFLLSNPPWKEFKHLSPLELHSQQENYLFTHQVSNWEAVCISNKFTGTGVNIIWSCISRPKLVKELPGRWGRSALKYAKAWGPSD